ncbi:hypothetical protein AX16_009248 [Volvariella volvacea WC 439]|nr:hypothetical protein AX16_009248 [Volvariella volvacea WC 439]
MTTHAGASPAHRTQDSESLALTRERNSSLPSHRIPPEIISCITALLNDLQDVKRDGNLVIQGSYVQRVHFTSICHYWRAAAINDALLWTCINFNYPELVPTVIQRSKNLPLSVHFSTNHKSRIDLPELRRAIAAVKKELYRIHYMHLSPHYRVRELLRDLFVDTQTPRPPLRKLTLDYVSFYNTEDFRLLPCSTLTHLSLSDYKRYALIDLIDTLHSLPRLKYLKLVRTLPYLNDASTPPTQADLLRVPFPAPPILVLEDLMETAYCFLSQVTFTRRPLMFGLTCRPRVRYQPGEQGSGEYPLDHLVGVFASKWRTATEAAPGPDRSVEPTTSIRTLELAASLGGGGNGCDVGDICATFASCDRSGLLARAGSVGEEAEGGCAGWGGESRFVLRVHRYKWRAGDASVEYRDCLVRLVDGLPIGKVTRCHLQLPSMLDDIPELVMSRMGLLKECRKAQDSEGVHLEFVPTTPCD